ncbi:MAG TPA: UvrD-helicase domain-containing protein [Parachlamydiaceae bacterium]|nr:UvrD-helicase domain-containing protein [Parachlamydiaceae bacterium]
MNSLLNGLNEEQRQAALSIEGPLLVLAGAGSGKTRVVTFRIAHMLESGIEPSSILGLTFTNKAAAEMRERVHKLTSSYVLISTFHSLGAKILRESIGFLGFKPDFTIYDEEDILKLLKSCLDELEIKNKKLDPKTFRQLISKAKNEMRSADDVKDEKVEDELDALFSKVYTLYETRLKEYNAVDFDDLLYLPVKLFREYKEVLSLYQNRFNYLLIDEYQDTNASQYELARLLVQKSQNIFVVGDPDQSIYSWRGADIHNILDFEKDYPGAKVIRLEENYRSRENILKAANALITNNQDRYEKKLWSRLGSGEKIKCHTASSEREEASFIAERIRYYHDEKGVPYSQIALFYRTHAQSRAFEDYFLNRRIPYIIIGGISFYQRREIKDILAFLKVIYSNSDFISFLRTINLPKRGLGDATLDKLQLAASQEGMPIISYLEALVSQTALHYPVKISLKQMTGVKEYLGLISEFRKIHELTSIGQLVKSLIEESGYLNLLKEDPESYEERKENLDALIAKAFEWEFSKEEPTLGAFLEELSLKASLDETDENKDRLNMMTIHNGKGLEFTVAFLAGLEEDLFPHVNARDSRQQLEEERRLCYVGMTRAKEYLYLTNCMQRYIWGISRMQRPSRFIREIPFEYLEKIRSPLGFERKRFERKEVIEFIDEIDQTVGLNEEFSVGETIFHQEFGIGVIKHISESSVGKVFKIYFNNDKRERSLAAKYARLKKL